MGSDDPRPQTFADPAPKTWPIFTATFIHPSHITSSVTKDIIFIVINNVREARVKNGKKTRQCLNRGGLPQFIHFSLNLPGPQITWKRTMHTDKLTTICHICKQMCKPGGLMCGIWDWQSDNKCLLFTRLGWGVTQRRHCLLF